MFKLDPTNPNFFIGQIDIKSFARNHFQDPLQAPGAKNKGGGKVGITPPLYMKGNYVY